MEWQNSIVKGAIDSMQPPLQLPMIIFVEIENSYGKKDPQ
jgi:hypothetical protein